METRMIIAQVYCPTCKVDVLAAAHPAPDGTGEQARCSWCDTVVTLEPLQDPA